MPNQRPEQPIDTAQEIKNHADKSDRPKKPTRSMHPPKNATADELANWYQDPDTGPGPQAYIIKDGTCYPGPETDVTT